MAKVGNIYINKSGARYKLVHVTPTSNAVPVLEQWAFLVLDRRPFLDMNSQQFVTIPVTQLGQYFRGVESLPS